MGPEHGAMLGEQCRKPGRSIEEHCFSTEGRGGYHLPESTAQPDRKNRSITHSVKNLS